MPNKIKSCLEKSNIEDDDWKDEKKISSLINETINIDNNIKDINNIFDIIKNAKEVDLIDSIIFFPGEKELNTFLSDIKTFGEIKILEKFYFGDNSTIIKNKNSINFVLEQIRENNSINSNKKCDLKIIYRMSRGQDSCKTYHQKTNYIPDTLTLIKTKEDIIFGGYFHIKIPSCSGGKILKMRKLLFFL